MFRKLARLRDRDQFVLAFRQGSEIGGWVQPYLETLPKERTAIHVLPTTRRLANLGSLLGMNRLWHIGCCADLYLRFDAGLLGGCCHPLLALVADLSALKRSESSLAWHGRYLFKRALKETAQRSEIIVTISNYTRAALIHRYPSCAERVHVVPNGIADAWFETSDFVRQVHSPYWVWYGQMTPRKNLARLLAAYANLKAEGVRLPRLKFVGRPAHGGDAAIEKIYALGLTNCVDVVAPLPLAQLIAVVRGSRGLVFPSLQEGFGMPIIEAMAQGRPVLTSTTTAMPEVAGGHAILCDPLNIESIKSGLQRLVAEDQLEESATEARRRWARNFSAQAAAERYSALIDQAYREHCRT